MSAVETVEIFRTENITPEIFDAIAALLPFWHAECGFATFSEDRALDTIDTCLRDGAVVVAKSDGVIVGAMGVAVEQFWYSEDYVVNVYFHVVHPDHRRSGHAKHLIMEVKRAARIIGRPLLACVNTTIRTEGKCRLYRRLLTPIGQLFMDTASNV